MDDVTRQHPWAARIRYYAGKSLYESALICGQPLGEDGESGNGACCFLDAVGDGYLPFVVIIKDGKRLHPMAPENTFTSIESARKWANIVAKRALGKQCFEVMHGSG